MRVVSQSRLSRVSPARAPPRPTLFYIVIPHFFAQVIYRILRKLSRATRTRGGKILEGCGAQQTSLGSGSLHEFAARRELKMKKGETNKKRRLDTDKRCFCVFRKHKTSNILTDALLSCGAPFPRMRSTVSGWHPWGTLISTDPSTTSTLTLSLPRIASRYDICSRGAAQGGARRARSNSSTHLSCINIVPYNITPVAPVV